MHCHRVIIDGQLSKICRRTKYTIWSIRIYQARLLPSRQISLQVRIQSKRKRKRKGKRKVKEKGEGEEGKGAKKGVRNGHKKINRNVIRKCMSLDTNHS
jgi:hypothetical protein